MELGILFVIMGGVLALLMVAGAVARSWYRRSLGVHASIELDGGEARAGETVTGRLILQSEDQPLLLKTADLTLLAEQRQYTAGNVPDWYRHATRHLERHRLAEGRRLAAHQSITVPISVRIPHPEEFDASGSGGLRVGLSGLPVPDVLAEGLSAAIDRRDRQGAWDVFWTFLVVLDLDGRLLDIRKSIPQAKAA